MFDLYPLQLPRRSVHDNAVKCIDYVEKTALIEYLIDNWKSDQYAYLFCGKVYAYSGDKCYCYKSVMGMVVRIEENELYSTHEEADSRIFHHINTLPKPSNVVIRTADTDILVIAVGCRTKIDAEL